MYYYMTAVVLSSRKLGICKLLSLCCGWSLSFLKNPSMSKILEWRLLGEVHS